MIYPRLYSYSRLKKKGHVDPTKGGFLISASAVPHCGGMKRIAVPYTEGTHTLKTPRQREHVVRRSGTRLQKKFNERQGDWLFRLSSATLLHYDFTLWKQSEFPIRNIPKFQTYYQFVAFSMILTDWLIGVVLVVVLSLCHNITVFICHELVVDLIYCLFLGGMVFSFVSGREGERERERERER